MAQRRRRRMIRRRAWSQNDIRYLRINAGKTVVATMANHLRRSEGATRQKAFALNVSLETRNKVSK